MSKVKDLIGMRFGCLTVVSRAENRVYRGCVASMWNCQCDCGNTFVTEGRRLTKGETRSCGCRTTKSKANLLGKRFGKLTVVKRADNYAVGSQVHSAWICECDCGEIVTVRGASLRNGHTKSCGCHNIEASVERATKHGKSETRLYYVWIEMKQRCGNPSHKNYSDYGGRGITVCEEWLRDFQAFYDWAMANGYDETAPIGQCTIDRIENDKGYSPDNCRWTTMKEQSNNRRAKKTKNSEKEKTL